MKMSPSLAARIAGQGISATPNSPRSPCLVDGKNGLGQPYISGQNSVGIAGTHRSGM